MIPDTIIVLGGGIDKNGLLSSATENRVKKGVQLFQKYQPKGLIISGRWSLLYKFVPDRTESEAAKDLALSLGVPGNKIFTENKSMETMGNAYFVKKLILEPKNWSHLIIVTSDFHQKRTTYAFKKVLGSGYTFKVITIRSSLSPIKRFKSWSGENKLLKVYKQWLTDIPDGDSAKIKNLLYQLPGYSSNPKYTTEQLLKIIKDA